MCIEYTNITLITYCANANNFLKYVNPKNSINIILHVIVIVLQNREKERMSRKL